MIRFYLLFLSVMMVCGATLAKGQERVVSNSQSTAGSGYITKSKFVSSAKCTECHQQEHRQWVGSHHEKAMQKASDKTVLGDFNRATFDYQGELTTFYKKNRHYFINTVGPDGEKHDYEVKYTFGVTPLQQYLVELPGGRLQAFTIAWDQPQKKWFHLHPNKKITPKDPLHWSKAFYNWNSNCAECHSTHLQKNYDSKTKTYHTTWSSIHVGCQACHGPGKRHVDWAKAKLSGKVNKSKNKGLVNQYDKKTPHQTMEMCASCHSRRHPVSTNHKYGQPLFDHFMPAILRQDLYYPDGQIKEEVFVYGSFLQSKMYRAGVTCMNCHNPHSLKLKQTGNGLCTQCHNATSIKQFKGLKRKNYNSPTHFHHKPGSAGAQCVNCHMPGKVYMKIDFRRDHSFRIPRPDLTEKIGSPNACNQCHTDKSPAWASKTIQQWFGKKKYPEHFGEIFVKARGGEDVEAELIHLSQDERQANIVRATAIELLARYERPKSIKARVAALASKNVLIRETALRSLARLPINERVDKLAPLLKDPARAVRIEAASILASAPSKLIPAHTKQAFKRALHEYESLQKANLDMPSSYLNLGNLYQKQGDPNKAIEAYQLSIDLDKRFYPSQQNLATLLTTVGRPNEAKQVLREATKHNKEQGELYYSLGLLFAETNEMNEALPALARAAALLPHNSRVHYNYALALQHRGKIKRSENVLTKAYELNPRDPDILYALAILHTRQKNWAQALQFAKALGVLFPESRRVRKLIRYLQSQRG